VIRVAVTLEQCWHRVPGGTAVAALETVRALQERGDVDLVGVSARHREPPEEPWAPPVTVRPLPLPRLALYEAWHGLRWPPVQRATGPVDVVHATAVAMPPARGAPVVVTVHDLAFLHDPGHFTRHGVRFFRRATDLARRDAALVLCSSQATLEDCAAHGFDRARLRLVPLGVRAEPAGADEVARIRAQLGIDGRIVFWTGTHEPRKNLPGLLAAFERLDRDDVTLVLGGPRGWKEDLDARLEALGGRARAVGFLSETDKRAVLAAADLFCYPSLLEGFGLPVLEAMAQGTPVVTATGTATEELAEGGAALAVDPRDAGALAAAMARVLDDDGLASRLADAGRGRVAEYTWARTAERTAAAYAEVA
jgi:glycosyltransferase involved in cell wall biosynthesis